METLLEKLKWAFAHQAIVEGLPIKAEHTNRLAEIAYRLSNEHNANTVLCGEGHNEAITVHGDNTITNDQSQTTTLNAPNVLLATEAGTRLVSVCPHIDTKPLFGRMEQCLDCKEVLMIGG